MANLDSYKNLWVFIETIDGEPKSVGLELLTPARSLADDLGQSLVAVILGSDNSKAIEAVKATGLADEILSVENDKLGYFATETFAYALVSMVEKYLPAALLVGATNNGRDFAPRVSCRLRTGLTADCTNLSVDEETKNIVWTRPAFGGNLMACIMCPDSRPQIGTVRPGVFKKTVAESPKDAKVTEEKIDIPEEVCRTTLVASIREAASEMVKLEDAEFIVSGGRGVGGPEGFEVIKALADALGGAVGASRAAVDSEWISHYHQVGQTGKTVAPKVYIACGISGAIQHMAGCSGSDVIIAINKDPEAPIFKSASYGIVGNLFDVVPALTAEIKKLKEN